MLYFANREAILITLSGVSPQRDGKPDVRFNEAEVNLFRQPDVAQRSKVSQRFD